MDKHLLTVKKKGLAAITSLFRDWRFKAAIFNGDSATAQIDTNSGGYEMPCRHVTDPGIFNMIEQNCDPGMVFVLGTSFIEAAVERQVLNADVVWRRVACDASKCAAAVFAFERGSDGRVESHGASIRVLVNCKRWCDPIQGHAIRGASQGAAQRRFRADWSSPSQ